MSSGLKKTLFASIGPMVTISGFDGKPDPNAELPEGRMRFSDYRVEVDLSKEATTKDFAVPAGGR